MSRHDFPRAASELTIVGCSRGSADPMDIISAFRKEGFGVQPVRADMVFGDDHIKTAYMHAARAFARGTNSSGDLMTELLMYAACETQIAKAIEKMKVTSQNGIVLCISPMIEATRLQDMLAGLGLERDDSLMDADESKLVNAARLGIRADAQVTDSVIERIAMIDLLKR